MTMKLMIRGCSSSSLTWSSSWQSSRYPLWDISALILNVYQFYIVVLWILSVSSPDGPLSGHLWHPDQLDDQLDINWDGKDRLEMLIQQGEEPCSAIRWHHVHHFLSHHWHSGEKASRNDLLMRPERPVGEGANTLHASFILFWAVCLQEASK